MLMNRGLSLTFRQRVIGETMALALVPPDMVLNQPPPSRMLLRYWACFTPTSVMSGAANKHKLLVDFWYVWRAHSLGLSENHRGGERVPMLVS